MTSSGNWGRSGSCTSATAREPAAPAPRSAWCRWSTTPAARCAGSSKRCGPSSTTTTPARAPLFPSERSDADGSSRRVGYDILRAGLAAAVTEHLPAWTGRLTPHVLRHYCASQMYLGGVDLISIQEMLGHCWVTTTMGYERVHRSRIEQAWIAGQERAARRLERLV